MGQQFDSLQCSISKLAQQLDHQGEENPEEVCLSGIIVEDHCQQQLQEGLVENFKSSGIGAAIWLWEKKEATSPLLTEKSNGQETVEGTQDPIIQPNPIDLDPNATAQPKNNPLPVAPSVDQVYLLPTPAAKSKPAAPAPKAKSNPSLPAMQNFKRLVASIQNFATTSKTLAVAYVAWLSGWFGCRFGFGAPGPRHL